MQYNKKQKNGYYPSVFAVPVSSVLQSTLLARPKNDKSEKPQKTQNPVNCHGLRQVLLPHPCVPGIP